jgi:signal transduction histidine kinase
VYGDRGRVRQALENMFRNATEHAEPGGETDGTAGDDGGGAGDGESAGGDRGAGDDGGDGDDEGAGDGRDAGGDGDRGDGSGGDDDLTVLVTPTEEGFLVADDGTGVDPGDRGSVFESGFTTRADGTGYGLDIVREVVESHGWTVELRCDADGHIGLPDGRRLRQPSGACFEVCAPGPADADPDEPWIGR